MNQPHVEHEERAAADAAGPQGAEPGSGVRAVAGPFGLRDIVVGSAVLVMLIGSILPFTIGSGRNLWTAFSLFYVGIGILMPLVVAGLFAARRLAPSARLRVGSLSLDQFASVIAVLAAIFFFLQIVYVFSVGSLLGLIGSVALLAATTFAPHIPPFAAEFSGRTEIPAHPVARDAKPLIRVPKPAPAPAPKPGAAGEPSGANAPGMFGQGKPAGAVQGGAPQTGMATGGTPQQPAAAGHGPAGYGTAGQPDGAAGAPAGDRTGTAQTGSAQGAGAGTGTGAGTAAAAGATAGAAAAGAAVTPSTAGTSGAAGTPDNGGTPGAQATSGAGMPGAQGTNATESGTGTGAAGTDRETAVPAGEDPLPATTVNPAVQGAAAASNTQSQESISATREENENVVEAFWFAVGTPRQIVDERTGLPLFMFYPGDWELGLEDRGHEFLVQDKRTGRIGVLRDLTNIERVSDDSSGH